MKQYPFHTRVCGPSEISESKGIIAEVDVEDYYKRYGRGSFIWFETWDAAYDYCMKENKRLMADAKETVAQYKKTAEIFKLQKKLRKVQ
jgi:hypothetical protein